VKLSDLLNQAADTIDVGLLADPAEIRSVGDRRTARARRRAGLIGASAVVLIASAGTVLLTRVGDHKVGPAPAPPAPSVLPPQVAYLNDRGISFVAGDGSRRTLHARNVDRFAISPSGQQIAYITYNSGTNRLWLADGNGTHRVRQPEPCRGCMPGYGLTWSNDGTRLAYSVFTPGKRQPAQLRVVTVGSREHRTLKMPRGCDARGPRFSPDDQSLAVNLSCADAEYVAILDPDRTASRPTLLSPGYNQVQLPSWSGDGRTVYFTATTIGDNTNDTSGSGNVLAVRADGTGLRQITHARVGERFFGVTPYRHGFLVSRAYRRGPWTIGWLNSDGKSFTPMKGTDGRPTLGHQAELRP
jgi:hypothetical protein